MNKRSHYHVLAQLSLALLAVISVRPCAAAVGLPGGGPSRPLVSIIDAPSRATDDSWRPIGQSIDIPGIAPLSAALAFSASEQPMFDDAADGRLDELDLVAAAIVASGIQEAPRAAHYHRLFEDVAAEVRRSVASLGNSGEKLQCIHRLLHQRLLRGGYDANATDLSETLETGVYNCASATILFVALAESLGLKAHAVELPGHVRAAVEIEDRQCEIEVTSRSWREAIRWTDDSSFADPPAHTSAERREISPVALIATIYYNRAIDAFYDHRFAQAVVENRKALLLDPKNAVARGNLLAAMNNWALALCDAGQFEAAQSLLAAGHRFAPEHLPFTHNAAHVQYVRTHAAIGSGRPSG